MNEIECPKCGSIYHVALYDFEYIYCNRGKGFLEPGCGTVFDKETGKILAESMDEYKPD